MKNPSLEKKLQDIEAAEKKRRMRAAAILSKKKASGKSRQAVMKRMITQAKQAMYAQRREVRRPMFGTGLARDRLCRPQL